MSNLAGNICSHWHQTGEDPSNDRNGLPKSRDGIDVYADVPIKRVLVVEDEVLVRMDIEHLLTDAGYHVIGIADTADRAVQAAVDEKPDIVLMDIRLLGTRDGIDAALEIWQRLGIRSVFVSANIDAQMRSRAAVAHPLGFVEKPFTVDGLLAALRPKN